MVKNKFLKTPQLFYAKKTNYKQENHKLFSLLFSATFFLNNHPLLFIILSLTIKAKYLTSSFFFLFNKKKNININHPLYYRRSSIKGAAPFS